MQRPATAREIEGYAAATSVDRGGRIGLHVHTFAPSFALEVFRIGWYQGLGARRVHGPVVVPGTAQRMPPMDPESGLVDCAWIESYALQTGDDWVSGVYLVRSDRRRQRRPELHPVL